MQQLFIDDDFDSDSNHLMTIQLGYFIRKNQAIIQNYQSLSPVRLFSNQATKFNYQQFKRFIHPQSIGEDSIFLSGWLILHNSIKTLQKKSYQTFKKILFTQDIFTGKNELGIDNIETMRILGCQLLCQQYLKQNNRNVLAILQKFSVLRFILSRIIENIIGKQKPNNIFEFLAKKLDIKYSSKNVSDVGKEHILGEEKEEVKFFSEKKKNKNIYYIPQHLCKSQFFSTSILKGQKEEMYKIESFENKKSYSIQQNSYSKIHNKNKGR